MRGRETTPARAKPATPTTLKRDPGKERIGHRGRQKLIDYHNADQGARPPEPADLAHVALKRLGLVGKCTARNRRTGTARLNRLFRR